jgi:hypothetical protein
MKNDASASVPIPSIRGLWVIGFFSLVLMGMEVMTGCGTVGAPIPPQDLPVAQKLLKEKEREAREKSKAIQEQKEEQAKGEEKPEGEAIAPEEVPLPPLRPVGTR